MARTLLVVSLVASTGALFVGCTQDFNVFKPGGGGAGSSTAVTSVVTSAQSTGVGGGGVDCTSTDLTMCEDNNVCTNESCIGGKCAHANVADGLKPGYVDNTADCVDDVCMGGVLMAGAPDNTEIPTAPNICSTPSCAAGLPVLTPDLTKNGMSCGAGILQCDAGDCVGCVVPTDCPVSATEPFCTMRTCSVTKVCGLAPDHEGTATPTGQTGNDCKSINCVAGVSTSQDANGDAPVSALPCKVGSCSGGVPATNFPVVNCGTAAQCPTATSQHLQDVCQGAAPGNCVAGATTNCTGSFNCTNNVCNASCADDTHCVTGKHCDTTVGSAN